MSASPPVVFCQCAYARIIPEAAKAEVRAELAASGATVEEVPDLCAMSACKDPALQRIASSGEVRIAACYPRAVRWLFHAAGAPLSEQGVEIVNMRTRAVPPAEVGKNGDGAAETPAPRWYPWFPVIDYQRCTNCMQCLSFCLFDVYGVDAQGKIQVQNEEKCKTNCPACSRVCPEVAILFPKYKKGPINGDEVRAEDVQKEAMKVDISALLGGDIYAALRDRTDAAKKRFSTERDESRALLERKRCLQALKKDLDIPDEVLMTLPSAGEIQERAARAKEKLEKRMARSQTVRDRRVATEEDWGI